MKKNLYESPEMNVLFFEWDVITASNGMGLGDNEEPSGGVTEF